MTQTTARLLAKALSVDGKIYVAKSAAAHRGQFDGPDEPWIVVDFHNPYDVLWDVPEGMIGAMFAHITVGEAGNGNDDERAGQSAGSLGVDPSK